MSEKWGREVRRKEWGERRERLRRSSEFWVWKRIERGGACAAPRPAAGLSPARCTSCGCAYWCSRGRERGAKRKERGEYGCPTSLSSPLTLHSSLLSPPSFLLSPPSFLLTPFSFLLTPFSFPRTAANSLLTPLKMKVLARRLILKMKKGEIEDEY